MSYRAAARNPWSFAVISAIAIAFSLVFRGFAAAEGMALGLIGAGFCIVVLWLIIKQVAQPNTKRPGFATFIIILAFFAKLPLYMILGMFAHAIGGSAPTCFLLGVGLVYFALVGWALAQS